MKIEIPLDGLVVQAPLPELLTQGNVQAVIGLTPRQFLDAIPSFAAAGGMVLKLGRVRAVDRSAFIAAWRAGKLASNGRAIEREPAGVGERLGLRKVK